MSFPHCARAYAGYKPQNIRRKKTYPRVFPAGLYSACPARLRASSRGVSMMEQDAAPAGVRLRTSRARAAPGLRPGAIRPPARSWLTMRARCGSFGSAARTPTRRRQWSAGRRAFAEKRERRASKSASGRPSPGRPRDAIASIPRFPALRSPRGGEEGRYGLPGAAKNTGDGACLNANIGAKRAGRPARCAGFHAPRNDGAAALRSVRP